MNSNNRDRAKDLLERIKTREELISRGYAFERCKHCSGIGCVVCDDEGGKWKKSYLDFICKQN